MSSSPSLLVDVGNSRFKWIRCESPGSSGSTPLGQVDLDAEWGSMERPGRVVVSCVGGSEVRDQVADWCRGRWTLDALFIESRQEELGVTNTYRDPTQLGSDRWAALLGARDLTRRATIVIDSGTAVTVDALDADGRFLGGVIMPGAELMRESLSRGTRKVLETRAPRSGPLGLSTAECVQAGVSRAVAGGVESVIGELRPVLGDDLCVIVTGGGAAELMPWLGGSVHHEPDLVLRGLARIAEQLP